MRALPSSVVGGHVTLTGTLVPVLALDVLNLNLVSSTTAKALAANNNEGIALVGNAGKSDLISALINKRIRVLERVDGESITSLVNAKGLPCD